MRGEFIAVWNQTWSKLWIKLAKQKDCPPDLFSELYRSLFKQPIAPQEPEYDEQGNFVEASGEAITLYRQAFKTFSIERVDYEEAITGGIRIQKLFRAKLQSTVDTETDAVRFLEKASSVIQEFEEENFSNRFFLLVQDFIEKYSLRYDLRRPFSLHPTLPGVFARLFQDLKTLSKTDEHLNKLMWDYEEAFRDLRHSPDAGHIKTCLSKQYNLLEGLATLDPAITETTLGAICLQLTYWPHQTLQSALSKLYGFRGNFPGMGHGSRSKGALREIEMRDMIAVSVLLAGFTPYLTDKMNLNAIYGGSINEGKIL
jgi:hypothetical protein